jgi:hypothetical protein
MFNTVLCSSMLDPAPPHVFYSTYFSSVDLIDRNWNSVEENHAHNNWRTRMIRGDEYLDLCSATPLGTVEALARGTCATAEGYEANSLKAKKIKTKR